jgi:hypothetical protein
MQSNYRRPASRFLIKRCPLSLHRCDIFTFTYKAKLALKWFDTTEVDALADELVRELVRRIPAESVAAGGKKAESKQNRTREVVLGRAVEFAGKHDLNFYKKARLANRFKWALRDAGYPADFVDEVSFELAATMASRKGQTK